MKFFQKKQQKVANNLDMIVIGKPKSSGVNIERAISELYEDAESSEGVYNHNMPVSLEMTVEDLLNWHCDYNWTMP